MYLPIQQGCHQIRKIREFYFQSGKIRGNCEILLESQGTFKFSIVLFQSSDFLHTQPRIQLSVIVAKFYVLYIILFDAVILKCNSILLWNQKFERPKISSRLSDTPNLFNDMMKKWVGVVRISMKLQSKEKLKKWKKVDGVINQPYAWESR